MPEQRLRQLHAALGFARVPPDASGLGLLHRWLDCWRGVGDVVVGMKRQGYEVSLGDHGSGQWIAVFLRGASLSGRTSASGGSWGAVHCAAWEVLKDGD